MKKVFIVAILLAISSINTVFAMDKVPAEVCRDYARQVEAEMKFEKKEFGYITSPTAKKADQVKQLCSISGQEKSTVRLAKERAGIEQSNKMREKYGVKNPTAKRALTFDDIDLSEEL